MLLQGTAGKSSLHWSDSAGQDYFQGGMGEARAKCLVPAARQLVRSLLGFCASSLALLWPYFNVQQRKKVQSQLWITELVRQPHNLRMHKYTKGPFISN